MEHDKSQAVLEWPTLKNIKQLRGFLGLTGYYRHFVKGYASIAALLTELLKKDAFEWSNKVEVTFTNLKKVVTTAPLLRLPDFTKPFILEIDGYDCGIGVRKAILLHFFQKNMSSRMQAQSAYTRELHAITKSLSKFCHYLVGHKLIIWID